jgi:hypothetical protein
MRERLSIRVRSIEVATKRQRRRAKKRRSDAFSSPSGGTEQPAEQLRHAELVEPLVYSRKQAAEALGISVATLDRRIVPALNTVKTPWGTRMIPVGELERFLEEHTEVASAEFSPRRPAGRRPSVPPTIAQRIEGEHRQGRSLGEIARMLTEEGVSTAHGGRRWWPSTVRSVLTRTRQVDST